MEARNNEITIQENVPFGQCKLWELQRRFFDKEGIRAWEGQVPFYITNNPYLANSYANIIVRFFQDYKRRHDVCETQPFYMLELGVGSGQFSFYMLRQLAKLKTGLALDDFDFVYVMTDFTESNVDFWRSHPALQEFVAKGILDFGVYDVERDEEITLLNSGRKLSVDTPDLRHPLIVMANYVFDGIRHDVFKVRQNKLQVGNVSLFTQENNSNDCQPLSLDHLSLRFAYEDIANSFYEDDELNALLEYYLENLDGSTFTVPAGAIQCVRNLERMSGGRMLMLACDCGHTELVELKNPGDPAVGFHSSFSILVNFQAIHRLVTRNGGKCHFPSPRSGIRTAVFSYGLDLDAMPEVGQAFKTYLDNFAPGDLFNIYSHLCDSYCTLETLLSHFHTTHWDPHVLNHHLNHILDNIQQVDEITKTGFQQGMAKIAANYYFLPGNPDTFFSIGLFFQTITDYQEALAYYRRSEAVFPEVPVRDFNLALCCYHLKQYDEAEKYFSKLAEDKNLDQIRSDACVWLEHIAKGRLRGNGLHSIKDYDGLEEKEDLELINGEFYDLAPARNPRHEEVATMLRKQFQSGLDSDSWKILCASDELRLPDSFHGNDVPVHVVKPDICVIETGNGNGDKPVPLMITEVLSPETAVKDHLCKRDLYAGLGVTEYWLVHPMDQVLTIYSNPREGCYQQHTVWHAEGTFQVEMLGGIVVSF